MSHLEVYEAMQQELAELWNDYREAETDQLKNQAFAHYAGYKRAIDRFYALTAPSQKSGSLDS